MKIISVTYGKTINIGNYESIRVDLQGEVEPDEDGFKALQALKVHMKVMEDQIRQENKR